jgi:hypothetical protein
MENAFSRDAARKSSGYTRPECGDVRITGTFGPAGLVSAKGSDSLAEVSMPLIGPATFPTARQIMLLPRQFHRAGNGRGPKAAMDFPKRRHHLYRRKLDWRFQ